MALAAGALYARLLFAGENARAARARRWLLRGAVAFLSLALVARAIQLGTVPLFSPLEALTFYGWLVLVISLLLVRTPEQASVGTLLVPFGAACALVGALGALSTTPVNPLFRNPLFAVHTLAAFLGYSALSVACCAGILYLLLHDRLAHKKLGTLAARLPSLEELDRLGQRTVVLGLSLLTAGIVSGMVWAWQEWKVAWLWEPKGVWAILTWLLYAAYLVARNGAGWRGVRAAWISTVAFVASIFTLLGTNYLLGWGRHVF